MTDDVKTTQPALAKPIVPAKPLSEKLEKLEKASKPEKLEKSEKSEKLEKLAASADGEKKKRGRKPAFKPTQFDLDLLHLIREGTVSPDDLLFQLGVARSELMNQLAILQAERLVAGENGVYGLTVNGYNFYTSKGLKKVSLKRSFTGEVRLQKHKRVEKHEDPAVAPSQKHVNDFLSSTEVVDLGGKLGRMDLEEIIRRYGPSQEQRDKFIQQKVAEVVQPQTVVQAQKPEVKKAPAAPSTSLSQRPETGADVCDLCKSDFKLAVSNPELAKYGHCFCGAAYHKECYDSLLADSSHCIRCGKKLFLIIDKQSRDAIKGIRDVFE